MKKKDNPWEKLDTIIKNEQMPTGPEWFTANQFAERYRYSIHTSYAKLRALRDSGVVEQWKGKRDGLPGTFTRYRLKG